MRALKKSQASSTGKKIAVVSSSNLLPRYLDCVPIYIEHWLNFSNQSHIYQFEPSVYLISTSIPKALQKYSRFLKLIKPIPGIPDAFIAQNIRLLAAQFETADFCMVSDIDILPLRRRYFEALVECADSGKFVIGRDGLLEDEIAICYNIAKPKLYKQLVNLNSLSLAQQLPEIWELFGEKELSYESTHGGLGWSFDQKFLFRKLSALPPDLKVPLTDSELNFKRLDRDFSILHWKSLKKDIDCDYYVDFHIPLPVRIYGPYIRMVSSRMNLKTPKNYVLFIQYLLSLPFYLSLKIGSKILWKLKRLRSFI